MDKSTTKRPGRVHEMSRTIQPWIEKDRGGFLLWLLETEKWKVETVWPGAWNLYEQLPEQEKENWAEKYHVMKKLMESQNYEITYYG